MIRPRTETEHLYFQYLKTIKRLFNKIIENRKKHWSINFYNQE